jgi:integrase
MSVYLKRNTYFIDYMLNGKRKREAVGPDKRQAELALKKRKIEIAEGKFFDVKKEKKIKFDDFARTYRELHSKVNHRPSVARRNLVSLKNLSSSFSGKYLSEITPQLIERYKSARIKSVSPATVNRELATLKSMFNKAILWNEYDDNPVRKVKLLKENNKRIRYLEKEEIARLLDACAPHLKPIVTVALYTGMRRSEIFSLKWQNIDIKNNVIYLLDTKNGERREVMMNETVKKTLIAVSKHPESAYVFCRADGKPYTDVKKSFHTALKKCGIISFRFHDLRHTFASQLVMNGVDLKTVQELLGHKSIEMTMRYAHLSPTHKKRAVCLLDRQTDTVMTPETASDKSISFDIPSNAL